MASGADRPLDRHLPPSLARESRFQLLTRVGFAARGLLYILVAVLAIGAGRTEDLTGAIEYAGRGLGRILLVGIAAGLCAYGLWRLSDLFLGTEHPGKDGKALRKRALSGLIGVIYLYLAYKAVRVLLAGRSEGAGPEQHADTVLDLPGGTLVLFGIALSLAVAGAYQLHRAWNCRFLRHLREGTSSNLLIKWMGRLGYTARGVIFLVVAWLLFRAAEDRSASEAGSLERALDVLRGPLLVPIAAGLLLFGLFSLIEARFRVIHQPPIDEARRKLDAKLPG